MSVRRAPSIPSLVTNISFTSNWCSSGLKMIACDYRWTIENYNFYQDTNSEMLQSSIFTGGTNDELKWRLHLYTNGDGKENSGHLSIFLRLVDCDREEIKTTFRFSIIDAHGNEAHCSDNETRTFKKLKDNWGSFGWKKFVSVESLKKENDRFLPDNKLTIFCEISAFDETVNVCGQSRKIQHFNVPKCSLSEDLETILNNKILNDVMFTVCDEKFYAHKIILSARSRIFSELFSQETNSSQRLQLINVANMKKTAFAEMLRYIYTGKSPNLEVMAEELLLAADRYGLGTLKKMCEEEICKNLAVENAADVLIMADQYGAKLLKNHARDFIVTHFDKIKNTGGFQKMARSHPDILIDTMSVLAMKINGNMS